MFQKNDFRHAIMLVLFFSGAQMLFAQYAARHDYYAPLEPASGILHSGGQQVPENPGFHEYMTLMPEGNDPFLYMHYFSFGGNSDNNCRNMFDIIRGYGEENHYMGVQIGLNFSYDRSDGGNDFADGLRDGLILSDFDHYRTLNRPIYFRFGYECNGGWNDWDPANYRECFRRASLAMRDEMMDSAAIWNIYPASQSQTGYIDGWGDYFPGNAFIDWWSIDIFDSGHSLGSNTTNFLNAAHSNSRPVLVGEATPRYVGADDASDWTNWFADHFSMYQNYAMVKAQSYIHWNWGTSRWPTWGNARLDTGNSTVRGNYLSEMENPIWQHGRGKNAMRAAVGLAEVYVDASASGAGSGADWMNAFTSIAPAIAHLQSEYGRGIIRVAQGTYDGGFTVPNAVRLYGGYPAEGGVDADPSRNPTIIDSGNAGRCAVLSGTFSLMRGFTFQNGAASQGGAVEMSGADATLYHCVFLDNNATDKGGAVYVSGDRARIAGCVFHDNGATNSGGALYLDGSADALLYNNVFYGNSAPSGAGILVNGPEVTLDSCTIAHHEGSGAAIAANYSGSSLATVASLRNCILAFNVPSEEQYAVETLSATSRVYLYNPLFHGNSPGDYGGSGTEQVDNALSGDPLFVDASSGNYQLAAGSPAIDVDTPPLRTWLAFDLRSLERGVDGNGDASTGYDLGAYERQAHSALTLDSVGGIWGFGPQGGEFTAARMQYVLYNHTGASLSWSLTDLPDWLEADKTGGSLLADEEGVIRFSFKDTVKDLAVGEHGPETLTIRDSTHGEDLNRNVRIFVRESGPRIALRYPDGPGDIPNFTIVQVLFTETVTGVSADDLTVNGVAATAVDGSGAGPYTFRGFGEVPDGVVAVIHLSSGGIVSPETGLPFAGESWSLTKTGIKTGIRAFWHYE